MVFRAIEIQRIISKLACYPMVDSDGHQLYIEEDSVKPMFKLWLPTDPDAERLSAQREQDDIHSAIERLNEYKRQHGIK